MYECAAKAGRGDTAELLPIWHLAPMRALFAGPLGHNAPHAHSVPVLLAGLHEAFRLRISGGSWRDCRTAVIPAGLCYEFDVAGQPLAVLYLEPGDGGADALVPLVAQADEQERALISLVPGISAELRAVYEARDGVRMASEALDDLLRFARPRARRALDPRIARAVASLASEGGEEMRMGDAARAAGLSPSRFQHLFAEEVGVPFRRFRVWRRLRGAIGSIAAGSSFTDAAHGAGFFDQAHFARAFRQAFGAPASPSLRRVRRG